MEGPECTALFLSPRNRNPSSTLGYPLSPRSREHPPVGAEKPAFAKHSIVVIRLVEVFSG